MAYKVAVVDLKRNIPIIQDAIVAEEGVGALLERFFDSSFEDQGRFLDMVDKFGHSTKRSFPDTACPYSMTVTRIRK